MLNGGFDVKNAVFSEEECDRVIQSLREDCSLRAGTRNLMAQSVVAAIALDERMMSIASHFLNSNATPFRATLFEKSVQTNWLVAWHQDTALPLIARNSLSEWGPWSKKANVLYAQAPSWALKRVVALRLHLDNTTQENGALRVIENTHTRGILSHEEITKTVKRRTVIDCEVEKGSVMSMSPLLIHSSSKVSIDLPRRVLHIEYADGLDLNGIRLAIA
jgi:ectoine hydroxylase-related dioxygenase (phytanoyl-CoA dioxygenase family)